MSSRSLELSLEDGPGDLASNDSPIAVQGDLGGGRFGYRSGGPADESMPTGAREVVYYEFEGKFLRDVNFDLWGRSMVIESGTLRVQYESDVDGTRFAVDNSDVDCIGTKRTRLSAVVRAIGEGPAVLHVLDEGGLVDRVVLTAEIPRRLSVPIQRGSGELENPTRPLELAVGDQVSFRPGVHADDGELLQAAASVEVIAETTGGVALDRGKPLDHHRAAGRGAIVATALEPGTSRIHFRFAHLVQVVELIVY